MSWPELEQYTLMVMIDATRPTNNVTVDLGVIPPTMAFDALRQAFEAIAELVEGSAANVFVKGQYVEPPTIVMDAEED